jgi:hypothetical protein
MQVDVYNQFYSVYYNANPTLGIWFDGSSTTPHPTHETSVEYNLAARTWTDEYAIVVVSLFPYNNTVGVGDYFEDFNVSLSIDWEDVTHDYFEDIQPIDASTGSGAYNFSLALPGDGIESYAVILNATPGTWYNVSIGTQDMSTLNVITSYAPLREYTYFTSHGDLNDELQNVGSDWSFQFGAITQTVWLEFDIIRTLSSEGHFWIQFTPMETYELEHPEPLTTASFDIFGMLGDLAVPLGIGAVVIVVVAVVYVKKFRN